MTDVKNVISHLCRLLNNLLRIDIKAEHVRLSKFNRTDDSTVVQLWNVLHKLCCSYINSRRDCILEGSPVTCVKLNLASLQYDNLHFYELPVDMKHGSRELLLAFGWMLAETEVLQIRIRQCVEYSLSEVYNHEDKKPISDDIKLEDLENIEDKLNHIQWLSGRLKHNISYIIRLISEKAALNTKVSVNEGVLKINDDAQQIRRLKEILEHYFYFINNIEVFWKWMETVLVEREKDHDRGAPVSNGDELEKVVALLKNELKNEIKKTDDECVNENGWSNFVCVFDDRCKDDSVNFVLSKLDREMKELRSINEVKTKEIRALLDNSQS